MKKAVKVLVYFFAVLGVLFLAAWVLVGFYKKEMVAEINAQLAKSLNGSVHIGDADLAFFATFPDVSLRLEEVYLRETENAPTPILHSERIYFTFMFYPLLKGEIHFKSLQVNRASIFVYRSKNGKLNVEGLRRKEASDSSSASPGPLNLQQGALHFKEVALTYHDSLRRKFFDLTLLDVASDVQVADSVFKQRLKGRVFFEGLVFNEKRGAFLKKKSVSLDLNLRRPLYSPFLFIDSSFLELEKSKLMLSGAFNSPDSGSVKLHIQSNELHYAEALSVLPDRIAKKLSVIDVKEPFRYAIDIVAPLGAAADPKLDMIFSFRKNHLASSKVSIDDLSLEGTFTNHLDAALANGDENTEIHISQVKGLLDKLPFEAEAWLTDLGELKLRADSKHEFNATLLNSLLDSVDLEITKGDVSSSFHYEGKLSEYLDEGATTFTGKLRGQTELKNVAFTWIPRKLSFQKINSSVTFNQDTVWLQKLTVEQGKNQLNAKGIICNYVPFFSQPTKKGFVKLELQSPSLDLSTLLTKRAKKKVSAKEKKAAKKKMSNRLHDIFSTLEFYIALDVAKIKRESFSASKLTGVLQLGKNQLQADKMKMNFAAGELDASFLMKDLNKDVSPIYLTAYTTNVNISQLFKSFDNFHQKAITSKHLEGTISTSVKLSGKINDSFEFQRASLWGPVNVTVKKGKINDLPAFQKLSSFLLKRRDFEHMQFAQIDGRFFVKGREIEIKRMEVQSNVLGLFLEGIYSTRNKTDLTIQIPLSNLKKRDRSFVPGKVGVDAKVGPSVFLRANTNEKGETEISYDLFHKFKKRK